MNYGWGSWHCTGGSDQDNHKKKKCKKAKWLSEEALQIPEKRREVKNKSKGKIYPSKYRVANNIKERLKDYLSDQCKEIKENSRMGKTAISSRKLEIPREHFMQRWGQ